MRLRPDGASAELSLGDLDGDGQPDVLLAGHSGEGWLFSGASLP